MKQNYFIINGEKYYTGAVFLVHHNGKQVEASFVYYDTDYCKYVYKIKDCTWVVGEKDFKQRFVSIISKRDNTVSMPTQKKMKDFEIDGLFLGWMWYIFLMLISVIFKDAIGLWILISVIFFSWRSNKIKKEGMYNEW